MNNISNFTIKRKSFLGRLSNLQFINNNKTICILKKDKFGWKLHFKNKEMVLMYKNEENGRLRVFQDYLENNLISGWVGRKLYKYAFLNISRGESYFNIETSIFNIKCNDYINSSKNIILKLENTNNKLLTLYKTSLNNFKLLWNNKLKELEVFIIVSFIFICG